MAQYSLICAPKPTNQSVTFGAYTRTNLYCLVTYWRDMGENLPRVSRESIAAGQKLNLQCWLQVLDPNNYTTQPQATAYLGWIVNCWIFMDEYSWHGHCCFMQPSVLPSVPKTRKIIERLVRVVQCACYMCLHGVWPLLSRYFTFISIIWFTPGFLQYSDIVVWAPGMASGLWKAGCWFVGGDDLTGALAAIKSWMETLPTLLHVGCETAC